MSIDSRFDRSSRHTVYVIRGLHTSLLGRPAIQALHVLQRPQVDSLSAMTTDNPGYNNNVISDYPQLFTGLGEMHRTLHHIHLADNATPYSLSTPRRVPVALIAKVDATLGKMESQGVIRRIDEPTEWCAGMVVVPKSNGDVHVCGDFTKLNHSIQRERHILPSEEHLLANIGNATVFSKLDANSGFHQLYWTKLPSASPRSLHRPVDTAIAAFHLASRQLLSSSKNGCRPFLMAFPASFVSSMTYCIAKVFRQRKISSKVTVRRFVRNLFSSNVGHRLLLFDRSVVVLLLIVDFHIHEYL